MSGNRLATIAGTSPQTSTSGTTVASYAYDAWGVVTINTESFANGWHNPYLYDGRDGVREDTETGLYWMSVRAYDPSLGRFISQDPLGRAPLMGWTTQPYAYAGNNPLLNVDSSGQRFVTENAAEAREALRYQRKVARVQARRSAHAAGAHAQSKPTVHRTTMAMSFHLNVSLPWFDWGRIKDWLVAGLMGLGGVALILAGLAAQPEDPVGMVSFANGVDLLIHAVTLVAQILWGVASAAYKILVQLEAVTDALVAIVDVAAISVLLGPEGGATIFAALRANSAALALVGTLTGVDLVAALNDFTEYFTHSLH